VSQKRSFLRQTRLSLRLEGRMLWVQRCDRVLPVGDDLADVHGGHAARRGAATSHGGWPDQARRGLRPHRRSGAVLPDLRDVVITANALPCQRAHAEHLRARGAHYLFSPSRPTSRRCARRWSGCPGRRCPDCCIALSATAGSSRAPSRSSTWTGRRRPGCSRTGPGQSRSSADAAAPGQVKPSVETVHTSTSLDHRDTDPRLLAGWNRSHWTIENRLHWVRDVTESADHSSLRTGNGPRSWPPCATPRSTSSGSAVAPTSPPPIATSAISRPTSSTSSP